MTLFVSNVYFISKSIIGDRPRRGYEANRFIVSVGHRYTQAQLRSGSDRLLRLGNCQRERLFGTRCCGHRQKAESRQASEELT